MILGKLISVLTFPGIIVHELAHKLACLISGVKVVETRLLDTETFGGYVEYEQPTSYNSTFIITVAPLIINSAIAAVLFYVALELATGVMTAILIYLGICVGMHAFPSHTDANNL